MKIALSLQYNDAFAEIAALTVPVIQRYALRHGYSLFVHRCDLVSPEIVWQRIEDVAKLLPDFDAVAHLDVDLLITNPEIKIGTIIAEEGRLPYHVPDLFMSTDCHGINDGFCVWLKKWASQCALKTLLAADRTRYSSPQHALPSVPLDMHRMPQRLTNSYLHAEYGLEHPEGEWEPGDFILHLPGMGNARRVEILKQHLQLS